MNRRVIALLSLGHGTVDVYSGALPLLLFALRPSLHLTYAMIGAASVLFTMTSSVVQPLFGYLSDRRHLTILLPLGCGLCAAGLSLAAWGGPYPLLLVFIAISGLGSALYHPEAARTTTYFSGSQRGSAMSLFSVGGNAGYALGPILMLLLLSHLQGAAPVALLAAGLLVAALLWTATGRMRRGMAVRAATIPSSGTVPWKAMILIILVVMLRAWVQTGLVYYLPYWAARTAGGTVRTGTYVSVFLFAGAIGTLVAGPLSDRWGRKRLVILSLAPLTPLLILFLNVRGAAALAVIALAGFLLISSLSLTIVLAQELMVHRAGMAAGLTTGFAMGMGGLGVLALGVLADHVGLGQALLFLALLPLPTVGLAAFVPAPRAADEAVPGPLPRATAAR